MGWGLGNQYEHNLKAMVGFRKHVDQFSNNVALRLGELRTRIKTPDLPETEKIALTAEADQLEAELRNAYGLLQDIEKMMTDKKAYLKGDNQYEIGAKILNLSNLMDRTIDGINENKPQQERIAGSKCAFNCMSGKDRTGIMDAVAKTMAVMAVENQGRYPTHEEFKNETVRKSFAEIFVKVALTSGSLDITGINTGAIGYKVGKEARLFGMSIEEFLNMVGLAPTTGG